MRNGTWFRQVAAAGAPIHAADLARWTGLAVSRGDVFDELRHVIRDSFGVRHVCLTSTGRAGLTLLLKAMRRLVPERRDEVVLPSYTCFSVAASVVKAGLRPRVVDISPETLDYDANQLENADFARVLAVVATNLYGLPNNLPAISEIARRNGAFLIDDAAQAMGASVGGRRSGTWGDAGLFSLDKGKNISAIDGGVVITNSDSIARALDAETASLPSAGAIESALGVVKALAYFLLLRPTFYWIPNAIPQLGLGRTVFTTDFPLGPPSRALVSLALAMADRLGEFTCARRANAAALIEGLSGVQGIRTISLTPGAAPVYLRLPVLVADSILRDVALEALAAAGIGASGSYPASIADIAGLSEALAHPRPGAAGGRYVARHIITLPTHPFVTPGDIARTIAAISEAMTTTRVPVGSREKSAVCAE